MKTLHYYFGLISPWTYLGHDELTRIVSENGVKVVFHPIQFGPVFAATGGLPVPKRSPQRQAWRLAELRRWSARKGLDLNIQPAHFPVDESTAAKCVLALQAMGENPLGFMGRAHRVVWVEDRDLSDSAIVAELLRAEGFDAEGVMNRAQQDDVAQAYDSGPEQAIEAGVFGAPTFIINDELFWGQDRLDWVEEEIKA
ncbi:MAG: 2-hydroxychromene-2-carboxylate isomerase [Alphaproteobacteria bacterium]